MEAKRLHLHGEEINVTNKYLQPEPERITGHDSTISSNTVSFTTWVSVLLNVVKLSSLLFELILFREVAKSKRLTRSIRQRLSFLRLSDALYIVPMPRIVALLSDASRSPVRNFLSVEIRSHQRNAKATRNKNGRKTALANANHRPSRAIFSIDRFRLRRSALFDAIKICDAMAFPPFRPALPRSISKHSATQIKV